ncbi:MAG TPA: penicillin-binding protein 2 [Streptosporangiaceae bacterium]|nr:penicillin-binding protein 2 [Streptosporangiaceae bacterium]
MAFALSLFAARLVQLEGLDSAQYRTASQDQQLAHIQIPVIRGNITSSDGTMLAMTVQTYRVFADPRLIPVTSRPAVAAKLAGPLKLPVETVLNDLNHPSSPQYDVLAAGVPVAAAGQVNSLGLPGIDMQATYNTVYPNGELAASIVGFTNSAPSGDGGLVGEAGLEQEYNSVLAGKDGGEEVQLGADGEPIPLTEVQQSPGVPAKSLRLTIQADIQWMAEQICRNRVLETHARNCSIVVMDPKTGAILAMAQYPTYNPASVTNVNETTNISVSDVFAPGSTLKPVTVAAALEKGGQTPMSAYTIPYSITMDGLYTFHDAEYHPTVRYTIAGILAHSSNVGMVQVAQHITPRQQYDYLRAFGLGSVSGLGLPGETGGLIPPPGSPGYYGDNRYEYAFGQGVGVTAIQMASVYATIANGGVRVQPTIVAGTTTAGGHYVPARKPASKRVISATTAAELMTMLQQVPGVDAQAGEPWGLIKGYTVAAKTGTAQVSDPGAGKCLCQYGSSYIGIVPADDPQLVVAVNIQDPQGKYYGDEVAGPAFFDVAKFALQTMKIAPDDARTPYIRLTAP